MTTTKRRRLEDRFDPAVIDAVTRECPRCEVPARRYCKGLRRRLVHFARCRFRDGSAMAAGRQ